eukprot:1767002-Pleurochrysis_carterae.AAC.1
MPAHALRRSQELERRFRKAALVHVGSGLRGKKSYACVWRGIPDNCASRWVALLAPPRMHVQAAFVQLASMPYAETHTQACAQARLRPNARPRTHARGHARTHPRESQVVSLAMCIA